MADRQRHAFLRLLQLLLFAASHLALDTGEEILDILLGGGLDSDSQAQAGDIILSGQSNGASCLTATQYSRTSCELLCPLASRPVQKHSWQISRSMDARLL